MPSPDRPRLPAAGAPARELDQSVVGPRRPSSRRRHTGRSRGPLVLSGPLSPGRPRLTRTPRDVFDDLVLGLVERLTAVWGDELATVEFGTEEVPQLVDTGADGWAGDWASNRAGNRPGLSARNGAGDTVPLGILTRPDAHTPARIVVFRHPVRLRARSSIEQAALVNEVLVGHIADLLGRDPSEIDP